MAGLIKLLLALAGAALALCGALLALLWWQQERLLFHPEPLGADHPFDFGADVHEVSVPVAGATLSALHLRQAPPVLSKGLVFYLHGNAGNLQSWFANVDFWRRSGFDLFMIDYRGYGKSSGRIASAAELEADVRTAWAQVAPAYRGKRLVLFGRSLGTGLAAALAAEVQPDLTVLVSPYLSLQALVHEHYPFVPSALLRYRLACDRALPRVTGPVLVAHGGLDRVIPPGHGQSLARLAPRGQWLLVPDAGHNDIHQFPAYLQGLAAALDAL